MNADNSMNILIIDRSLPDNYHDSRKDQMVQLIFWLPASLFATSVSGLVDPVFATSDPHFPESIQPPILSLRYLNHPNSLRIACALSSVAPQIKEAPTIPIMAER